MGLRFYLSATVERLHDSATAYPGTWFCLFSCFYFITSSCAAYFKWLWFDELFTWYLAQQPTLEAIWDALKSGVDPNPPLVYVVTSVSHSLFGTGELATRLPSIFAFWLALLFLFLFVYRRLGSISAFVCILVLSLTEAYRYSYEARSYSIVLACCCLALLCWQRASEGGPRGLALIGLSLSLGIALLSHYYAVLLFLPITAGEIHRSFQNRKVDAPVWVSITLGAIPILFLLPLIESNWAYSEHYWAQPSLGRLKRAIEVLLATPGILLLGLSAIVVLSRIGSGKRIGKGRKPRDLLPPHELVATGTLVILPILGFALSFLTNAYVPRYFLAATIGASLTATVFVVALMRAPRAIELLLLLLLGLGFAGVQAHEIRRLARTPMPSKSVIRFLEQVPEQALILSSPKKFLDVFQYTPTRLRTQLGCIVDLDAVVRLQQKETSYRSLQALSKVAGLPVYGYHSFVSENRHFYLQGKPEWLHQELTLSGFQLIPKRDIGRFVYEVMRTENPQ